MNTLKENIVETISTNCSFKHPVSVYMNHIVVKLPAEGGDFYRDSSNIETEITACVNQYFPEREEDVLIRIQKDGEEHNFKLRKTH